MSNKEFASRAAEYHRRLFRYGANRDLQQTVLAGRIVLGGWLLYKDSHGEVVESDAILRLLSGMTRSDVLSAMADLGDEARTARWRWWESEHALPFEVRVSEIHTFIDKSGAIAYALAAGRPPGAPESQEEANDIGRLVEQSEEIGPELRDKLGVSDQVGTAIASLRAILAEWNARENVRLGIEAISQARIDEFTEAFADAMVGPTRIANHFVQSPPSDSEPHVSSRRELVGMTVRVPKIYFVDRAFKNTSALADQLGVTFAREQLAKEEAIVIAALRELASDRAAAVTPDELIEQIKVMERPEGRMLITDFGGLLNDWWVVRQAASEREIEALAVDMGQGHENEAFIVDVASSLAILREPESELTEAGRTGVGLGVFPAGIDEENQEPLVRVEVGEYLIIRSLESSSVLRFEITED